jgi:hypothetical protein
LGAWAREEKTKLGACLVHARTILKQLPLPPPSSPPKETSPQAAVPALADPDAATTMPVDAAPPPPLVFSVRDNYGVLLRESADGRVTVVPSNLYQLRIPDDVFGHYFADCEAAFQVSAVDPALYCWRH